MANHLTPTELARESGLERRDVIVKCVELGVPIFNGRIDKTLFLSSLRELPGGQAHAASGRQRIVPWSPAAPGVWCAQPTVRWRASAERQIAGAAPPMQIALTFALPGYSCADWRSSVDVVCSRIFRQARVFSRSASKCLTTLRTRVAEISIPWRAQIRLKRE